MPPFNQAPRPEHPEKKAELSPKQIAILDLAREKYEASIIGPTQGGMRTKMTAKDRAILHTSVNAKLFNPGHAYISVSEMDAYLTSKGILFETNTPKEFLNPDISHPPEEHPFVEAEQSGRFSPSTPTPGPKTWQGGNDVEKPEIRSNGAGVFEVIEEGSSPSLPKK